MSNFQTLVENFIGSVESPELQYIVIAIFAFAMLREFSYFVRAFIEKF